LFCYLFRADLENPLWFSGGRRAPASKDSHLCWHKTVGGCRADYENPLLFRGGGRAPASKDSHLCWNKTDGGCCARQHKCVLAANTDHFWPSEYLSNDIILYHIYIQIISRVGKIELQQFGKSTWDPSNFGKTRKIALQHFGKPTWQK
jgi:hypothetical protein